jgi:hypothetical protein
MNKGLHSIDNAHQLRISNAVKYCKADSLVRTTRIFFGLWQGSIPCLLYNRVPFFFSISFYRP